MAIAQARAEVDQSRRVLALERRPHLGQNRYASGPFVFPCAGHLHSPFPPHGDESQYRWHSAWSLTCCPPCISPGFTQTHQQRPRSRLRPALAASSDETLAGAVGCLGVEAAEWHLALPSPVRAASASALSFSYSLALASCTLGGSCFVPGACAVAGQTMSSSGRSSATPPMSARPPVTVASALAAAAPPSAVAATA